MAGARRIVATLGLMCSLSPGAVGQEPTPAHRPAETVRPHETARFRPGDRYLLDTPKDADFYELPEMFRGTKSDEAAFLADWMKPLAETVLSDRSSVVDLRPLRGAAYMLKPPALDPQLKRIILGFDLAVFLADAGPATRDRVEPRRSPGPEPWVLRYFAAGAGSIEA